MVKSFINKGYWLFRRSFFSWEDKNLSNLDSNSSGQTIKIEFYGSFEQECKLDISCDHNNREYLVKFTKDTICSYFMFS